MKKKSIFTHSMDSLFAMLLFGMFVFFLLILLLFSSKAYKNSQNSLSRSQNLHTSALYITSKFRQHDEDGRVFIGSMNQIPALCFTEQIQEKPYITYLYVYEHTLRELFTSADNTKLDPQMGISIASVADFQAELLPNGLIQIQLSDLSGEEAFFFLHPGVPATISNNDDIQEDS